MPAIPDWEQRLIDRLPIIPEPMFEESAEAALSVFKSLRIPDLAGQPTFGEASEQWVFDFVRAVFGGYDNKRGKQIINEFFLLVSKKNSKSTLSAGIMLTALILCWRQDEEHLIIAPTKEVALASFTPAAAMVRADPELSKMLLVRDHIKTIEHRSTKNTLKVVAADTDTVSGKKAGRILIDELWVFGSKSNAQAMLMEATGGMVSRPEGFVIYLTTQSDEPPAGVFKEKLDYARNVRDGVIQNERFLPVIYEYPKKYIDEKKYLDQETFYITNPNLGRSVSKEWIAEKLEYYKSQQDGSFQQFLAKHLNVEIGMNLRNDRWAGADFWEQAGRQMTLGDIVARSDVLVAGIDGGGLDDLLGLAIIGRDKNSGEWLLWCHAWAHEIALERRKEIAPRLRDFVKDGDLTIVSAPGEDVIQLADILAGIKNMLPQKNAIGVDQAGIGAIVEELRTHERGFSADQIVGISQGWRLNGAIKTCERLLAGGGLVHCGQPIMDWCVSNARIVPVGNAISISKQESGKAKIDPVMAMLDAVSLMVLNPEAARVNYSNSMFFV